MLKFIAIKTAPVDLESSASSSDSDTNTDLSLDDDVDFDHHLHPEQAVLVDRDNELSRLKSVSLLFAVLFLSLEIDSSFILYCLSLFLFIDPWRYT
jgi:hypothetical protein